MTESDGLGAWLRGPGRRVAFVLFVAAAWALVAALIATAYIAERARLAGTSLEPHAGFSHIIAHGSGLGMLALGGFARVGWKRIVTVLVMDVAMFVPPVGEPGGLVALHVAGAMIVFGLAVFVALWATQAVRSRVTDPGPTKSF